MATKIPIVLYDGFLSELQSADTLGYLKQNGSTPLTGKWDVGGTYGIEKIDQLSVGTTLESGTLFKILNDGSFTRGLVIDSYTNPYDGYVTAFNSRVTTATRNSASGGDNHAFYSELISDTTLVKAPPGTPIRDFGFFTEIYTNGGFANKITACNIESYGGKLTAQLDAVDLGTNGANTSATYGFYTVANNQVIVNASGATHTSAAYGIFGQGVMNPTLTAGALTHTAYGGYLVSVGSTVGTGTAYGLYAEATGADNNYAGYFNGDVRIVGGLVVNDGSSSTGDIIFESDANASFWWVDVSAEKQYLGTTGVGAGYYSGEIYEAFDTPSGNNKSAYTWNAALGTSLTSGYQALSIFNGIVSGLDSDESIYGQDSELYDDGSSTGGTLYPKYSLVSIGAGQIGYMYHGSRMVMAGKAGTTLTGLKITAATLGAGASLTYANGIVIDEDTVGTYNYAIQSGGMIQVNSTVNLTENSVSLSNGDNANIDIDGGGFNNKGFIKITGPTGAFAITGIAKPQDGQEITIWNSTAQNMTIKNDDGGSTAANRIITQTGGNIATTGMGSVTVRYSASSSRWIVMNLHA